MPTSEQQLRPLGCSGTGAPRLRAGHGPLMISRHARFSSLYAAPLVLVCATAVACYIFVVVLKEVDRWRRILRWRCYKVSLSFLTGISGRGLFGQGRTDTVEAGYFSPQTTVVIAGDCRLELVDGRTGTMTCMKSQPGMSGGSSLQFHGVGPLSGPGNKATEEFLPERIDLRVTRVEMELYQRAAARKREPDDLDSQSAARDREGRSFMERAAGLTSEAALAAGCRELPSLYSGEIGESLSSVIRFSSDDFEDRHRFGQFLQPGQFGLRVLGLLRVASFCRLKTLGVLALECFTRERFVLVEQLHGFRGQAGPGRGVLLGAGTSVILRDTAIMSSLSVIERSTAVTNSSARIGFGGIAAMIGRSIGRGGGRGLFLVARRQPMLGRLGREDRLHRALRWPPHPALAAIRGRTGCLHVIRRGRIRGRRFSGRRCVCDRRLGAGDRDSRSWCRTTRSEHELGRNHQNYEQHQCTSANRRVLQPSGPFRAHAARVEVAGGAKELASKLAGAADAASPKSASERSSKVPTAGVAQPRRPGDRAGARALGCRYLGRDAELSATTGADDLPSGGRLRRANAFMAVRAAKFDRRTLLCRARVLDRCRR